MTKLHKIFWISLLIKLIVTAVCPMTNDETYYWVWSQHMQLSFFDHPPFVAWLLWLGTKINFYGNMVRWPAVLLGQAGLAIWLLVLKPYLSEEQRVYWLLLALLSPLVGGTNLIVTPDLPLIFFYGLSLFFFYRWREKPNMWMALLFGLSMGLGFSSKYVMVLFPLSLFPLVAISHELRAPLKKSFLWIFLGAVLGACPVWLWNILNDFASFRFQAAHGLGHAWKPTWTSDYILVQIALIFPPVLFWAVRARKQMPLVYHLLAWVPLGFFLCTTFRGYVEANWPIVAYPAVLALAASSIPRNSRSLKITIGIWGFVLAALFTIVIIQPGWSRGMKFKEFHEFDHLIVSVGDLNPLYARSYQMASRMSYDMKRPIYKLRGMANRHDFYDELDESLPKPGLYYLAAEKGDHIPEPLVKAGHTRTRILPVDETFEIWQMQAP